MSVRLQVRDVPAFGGLDRLGAPTKVQHMCGRYSLARESVEVTVGTDHVRRHGKPRYNIAPSQRAPVIRRNAQGLVVDELRWGLIPEWSRDDSIGFSLINARSETLAEKPAFRGAFRSRRCLVLADGFYEWQALGRSKQPWRFVRGDGAPLLFAGLWECWQPTGLATPMESFTVVTKPPNAVVAPIHDRMPACLDLETAALWLDASTAPEMLLALLKPSPETGWTRYRVNPVVGQARHEGPECIEEHIEALPEQPSLF
jgi:putative SOS response-associated peptidase YedK